MTYDYSFSVWPDERRAVPQAVFDLFRMLGWRVEMPFTEDEFVAFRLTVGRFGLTLREVSRVPHREPEAVE